MNIDDIINGDSGSKILKESMTLGLMDRMTIGKRKGDLIQDYIDSDPLSLKWFVESKLILLSNEAFNRLDRELEPPQGPQDDPEDGCRWGIDEIFGKGI